jgi:hypothetical protein
LPEYDPVEHLKGNSLYIHEVHCYWTVSLRVLGIFPCNHIISPPVDVPGLLLNLPVFIYLLHCTLGLGFRPMPPESNVESTLIWYRGNDERNYKYWTEELDKFLQGKYSYSYSTFHCMNKAVSLVLL